MYAIFARLLQERGIRSADVAKATGLNPALFTDWKMGRYTPKQDKLQKIADYFGVSLDYLVTGSDPIPEDAPTYYLDEDARELAEFLFKNPQYKVLFDASRKVRPEDIGLAVAIMNRLKK